MNASNEKPGAAPSLRAGDENDSEPPGYSSISSLLHLQYIANAHKQMISSLETRPPEVKICRVETGWACSVFDFVDVDFLLNADYTSRRLLLDGDTVTILSLVKTTKALPSWVTGPEVSPYQDLLGPQKETFYTDALMSQLGASNTPEPQNAAQESTSHTEILTNLLQAIRTGNDDPVLDMIRQNASLDAIAANLRDAKARIWNQPQWNDPLSLNASF